ncbi:sulfite exporter TauE/SafE family protein [Natribacillus halophilus]|uniref:sulfite exporter TauE/SafE family protein n=1 Tax=Natribacillus halophilus TaxID=549003 RepID=UPI0015A0A981|nr:sulfite exporter TauE/SafE family protein [Natribacillus halophilus]
MDYLFILILALNLLVGILLGMSSIGGFLLPLIYVGFLQLPLRDALALSFLSFAIAGIIGSYAYWKSKNIDVKLAIIISIGSIPGAFLGVQLNVIISDHIATLILYIFVLISGISLLFNGKSDHVESPAASILENKLFTLLLGFSTATVCAVSGAGGPILLVPLLTKLGLSIRVTVGVCLFNSVIIALPSMFGYFQYANMETLYPLIVASIIGQIAGILAGSYLSNKVELNQLRKFITWFTILTATYMIISLFL